MALRFVRFVFGMCLENGRVFLLGALPLRPLVYDEQTVPGFKRLRIGEPPAMAMALGEIMRRWCDNELTSYGVLIHQNLLI